MRLANKVAIISGGARGIGRAAVELFAEEGATVYSLDLSHEDEFAQERIHRVDMDVTQLEQWNALVERVVGEQGTIDILV